MTSPLQATVVPLIKRHDVALLDLDGVVYVGKTAVPGARDTIATAIEAGMRFGYVTNNASRTAGEVGDHLRALGISAKDDEVITSAQAASRMLAERLPTGSAVLIVGTPALAGEVERVGLRAVWSAIEDPAGVVQGYSPSLSGSMLAEACVAVRGGAYWVATNTDWTLPSPRGLIPGNGSFVHVVAQATGATPAVAGKPEPAMHAECILRTGAQHPLIVGDRLDTDIEGARRAGVESLLVLTGVTTPADLLAAEPRCRPTYLSADLGGILTPHPEVDSDDARARCGTWHVELLGGSLLLAGAAHHDKRPVHTTPCDALRALAVLAWANGTTSTSAGDEAAARVLSLLGLPGGD